MSFSRAQARLGMIMNVVKMSSQQMWKIFRMGSLKSHSMYNQRCVCQRWFLEGWGYRWEKGILRFNCLWCENARRSLRIEFISVRVISHLGYYLSRLASPAGRLRWARGASCIDTPISPCNDFQMIFVLATTSQYRNHKDIIYVSRLAFRVIIDSLPRHRASSPITSSYSKAWYKTIMSCNTRLVIGA